MTELASTTRFSCTCCFQTKPIQAPTPSAFEPNPPRLVMKRAAIIIALCVVTAAIASCNRFESPSTVAGPGRPEAISYVLDQAKVIDDSSKEQLEFTLAALKERKKIDFSLVTVASTGDKSARDYSLTLARERKSGRNNETVVAGLLLLVADEDRNWHIQ